MPQDERGDAETEQKFLPDNSGQNKRQQRICGLTVVSFGLIALFVILILVLGIFALVWVFILTADNGSVPGISFVPKKEGSNLIWINRNEEKNNSFWGEELVKFFEKYYSNSNGYNHNCAYHGESATPENACLLDVTSMSKKCSRENANFGYDQGEGAPCILIRLDNLYSWTPEAYKTMEDLNLAKKLGMPQYLIHKIETMIDDSSTDPMLDTIWVTCEGENPSDRENIGPIQYHSPAFKNVEFQGIPKYYYPYVNQKGYKAPFVFVKFIKAQYNVVIRVECKLWAKNIHQNGQSGFGSVQFDLMID